MAIETLHPGVYVQEIPSGVRAITGVATSITAFVGRTQRGPENEPREVNGFTEFQRIFGGLWPQSTVSFAVRSFFLNGGGRAIVVRLTRNAAPSTIDIGDFHLAASGGGVWGDDLYVAVDTDVSADVADRLGVPVTGLFNLTVTYFVPENRGGERSQEVFRNLTVSPTARDVRDVLEAQSDLVRVIGDPGAPPAATPPAPPGSRIPAGIKGSGGSDGDPLNAASYIGGPGIGSREGLHALDTVDLFNLLCIPPPSLDDDTPPEVYQDALAYCVRRRAMLVVDPPTAMTLTTARDQLNDLGLSGTDARNAALYFPRLRQPDPTAENRIRSFVPCGAVAGVMARTDSARGVWKAPAGIDAGLAGVADLDRNLTDGEQDRLNPIGINCLRVFPFPIGRVVWGARTMRGADILADEYKYVPVRRLALYIEESLYRGTQWVVFEPNDEPLWAQIRLNLGAFMQNLFRQGAFEGTSPRDAYFIKCDRETTTPNDQNLGRVNILVGFAPLRPAEFVILQIQQIARAQA
jgi:phage tail sheath protein FI